MRTYAGHTRRAASNALYRRNLAKGQTGLSVAFDLPTQTGYDPDHPLARGEVGKVGVPVGASRGHAGAVRGHPARRDEHLDDDQRHRHVAARALPGRGGGAGRAGATRPRSAAAGTTQNDIIKEYLSRGTYVFPPGSCAAPDHRHRSPTPCSEMPTWNPINICSYHLQEAGATPVQELAFAMCTAIAVLDAVRDAGQVPPRALRRGRRRGSRSSSTPACASSRRCARCARSSQLWDEPDPGALRRRGREAAALPLRRAGQLARPDRGPAGEQRPADRARDARRDPVASDARARAVQLPAWNEALGLPRPWDQQWSLRMQQVLAYESDLLEYDDLFAGSARRRGQGRRAGRRARASRSTGSRPWAVRWRLSSPAT